MENLTYLLGCYFHQDWQHYGPTWQHALEAFLQDDPSTVAAVPGEIDDMLAAIDDDTQLERRLIDMGMAYDPPEGDRAWLNAVRDSIRAQQ